MTRDLHDTIVRESARDSMTIAEYVQGVYSDIHSLHDHSNALVEAQTKVRDLCLASEAIEHHGLSRNVITLVDPEGQLGETIPFFPLREEVSLTPSKGFAQELALEGLGELIKKAYETILRWLGQLVDLIKSFFNKFSLMLAKLKNQSMSLFKEIKTKKDTPVSAAPPTTGYTHIPAADLAVIGDNLLIATKHMGILSGAIARILLVEKNNVSEATKQNSSKYTSVIISVEKTIEKAQKEMMADIVTNAGIDSLYRSAEKFASGIPEKLEAGDLGDPTELWKTSSGTMKSLGYTEETITALQDLYVNRLGQARIDLDRNNMPAYLKSVAQLKSFCTNLHAMMPDKLEETDRIKTNNILTNMTSMANIYQSIFTGVSRAHLRAHSEFNSAMEDYLKETKA